MGKYLRKKSLKALDVIVKKLLNINKLLHRIISVERSFGFKNLDRLNMFLEYEK